MRLLPLLILLLLCCSLTAQINVGSNRMVKLQAGEIEAKNLDALRNSEILFIIRPADMAHHADIQSMLEDIWTFSKIRIVTYEELSEMNLENKDDYAFFTLEGHGTIATVGSTPYVVAHYYLHLYMNGDQIPYTDKELRRLRKKGEIPEVRFETRTFARVELYPTGELLRVADGLRAEVSFASVANPTTEEEHEEYVQNEAKFHNWYPGFLKNALQEVNRRLIANETRWIFASNQLEELANLKTETLYIPDYVMIKLNKFTGSEEKRHEEADLFGKYEYSYEIIDPQALSDKILTATTPFYYFNFVRSSSDAFYTVTNGLTGEIVYNVYDPATYNIKSKNMVNLKRSIQKID